MAAEVPLGNHHAIVVIAVEVSTVAGSTWTGQWGAMPDWNLAARGAMVETVSDGDLGAWKAMMEGTTRRSIRSMASTGDRYTDTGRAGRLGMRVASRGWDFRDGVQIGTVGEKLKQPE